MKASKTENRFQTSFQQPKTGNIPNAVTRNSRCIGKLNKL